MTGLPLDVQATTALVPPPTANLDAGGRYQSFSLLIQPIPTRFELDEMCNLWDRDVTVYFDLHIGGALLQPYIPGDARGQIRSLNRQVFYIGAVLITGTTHLLPQWSSSEISGMVPSRFFHKIYSHNIGSTFVPPLRSLIRRDSLMSMTSVLSLELMYSLKHSSLYKENRRRADAMLTVTQNDAIRRESFGARLLDPRHGDVIFRFPDSLKANLEEKVLYASSELLCGFAIYFKQCTLLLSPVFPCGLIVVLQGEFRDSTPQSLEFQVNYNTDLNINVPALRVKCLDFNILNFV